MIRETGASDEGVMYFESGRCWCKEEQSAPIVGQRRQSSAGLSDCGSSYRQVQVYWVE